MRSIDELELLIKSRYPVIFFETADEDFAIEELRRIADKLYFDFFSWSLTDGLRIGFRQNSFYMTNDPKGAIQMILDLLRKELRQPGLFILRDIDKLFEDVLLQRLFKDLVNKIKGTKDTVIIVSSTYKLPEDLEPLSMHLSGGYPDQEEIAELINETLQELSITNKKMKRCLDGQELVRMSGALKGLTTQQIRNIIYQCVIQDNRFDISDMQMVEVNKKKIFDREGILELCITEDKGDIANFDRLKCWLSERKTSFTDANSGLPAPKGVMLMGVQGCGKSMAVKIIAREFALPLYRLDLGKLYSKYIGETEQNLRKTLALADKISPMCLWIDEIEKGIASSSADVDGGVSQRILGMFLTWMQERKSSCFIAATANDVGRLPPELLRKGRFDEIFFVDLPDANLRQEILRIHLSKRKMDPAQFDIVTLAERADGFNGAEIEQAIIAAQYRVAAKKEILRNEHIVEQLESTKPLSVIKKEDIENLREWARERTIPA